MWIFRFDSLEKGFSWGEILGGLTPANRGQEAAEGAPDHTTFQVGDVASLRVFGTTRSGFGFNTVARLHRRMLCASYIPPNTFLKQFSF